MLALPASAQELRTSYFMESSVYHHEMNPALLDKPYVAMPLILGNINVGTTGNVGLKNFIYKMEPGWQGYGENGGNTLTTFMHPNVGADEFLDGLKKNNRLSVNLKLQLFGVGFKAFGGVNVVDMNIRSNTNVAVPKSLFEFMKSTGAKSDYDISNLGVRTENYLELGLGHSRDINEKLRIGAKVKFLFGLAYADLDAKQLHLHLSDDCWKINGDIQARAALMGTNLKYEEGKEDPETGRPRVDDLDDFQGGLSGFGMAFDLGATYKVIPDLTLSASITDLGFISWNNVNIASSAGNWEFDGFENVYVANDANKEGNTIDDQFEKIGDDLEDMFAVYSDGKGHETKALAATINLGAEYTLPQYRKLRFGFLYSSRLAGKYSYHSGMFSANVAPVKWFDASLSIGFTSSGVTGGLVASLHARHFNIFMGTDRFFGKHNKDFIPINRANSNFSMGMSFPL